MKATNYRHWFDQPHEAITSRSYFLQTALSRYAQASTGVLDEYKQSKKVAKRGIEVLC